MDRRSSDHAVQNGSVRLQAVDSIAKRACGRRARIGRSALIRSSVEAGGLVGDDPAIDRQPTDRIIAARQRLHPRAVLQFQPIDVVDRQFGTDPDKNLAHLAHGLGALGLGGAGDHAQAIRA